MESPSVSRNSLALLWALFVGLLVACLDYVGVLEPLELAGTDKVTQVVAPGESIPAALAMIWITEADIQALGHPLSDAHLARVLQAILSAQPAAVGVDLYRDRPLAPGSNALKSLLLADDRIVVAEKLPDAESPGVPAPSYLPIEQRGFSDVPLDSDGTLRRLFLMLWDAEDRAHLSLPLRVALRYLRRHQRTIGPHPTQAQWLALGPTPLPPLHSGAGGYGPFDDRGYQYLLQPVPGGVEFTVTELLSGAVPATALKDRMVFLATSAPSVKDLFRTATNRAEYGGRIHGVAASQLVRIALEQQAPLLPWTQPANVLWILWWALYAGLAVVMLERKTLQLGVLLAGIGVILLTVWIAREHSRWLLVAAPLIALLATAMSLWSARAWVDRRDKAQVFGLFGAFVAKPIVAEIWRHRESWSRGMLPAAKQAPVTVLIADLSGFSAAANAAGPEQLMLWLEDYMESMSRQAENHGGVVNDFIGDGVMVNFGVPVVREHSAEIARDANNALHCAVAMCHALDQINQRWSARGFPLMRMRIGIASGTVVAGVYGSKGRMKYTTVGSTVNLAARLEAIDKESFRRSGQPHRVLVAAQTAGLADRIHRLDPVSRKAIRGFDSPIDLYALSVPAQEDEPRDTLETTAQLQHRAAGH